MNIARGFLVMASLYILVGVALGIHMGAGEDFTLAPLHAHINLLGFVSMSIFGVVYHLFPKMRDSILSKLHFWTHNTMVPILLGSLGLGLTGKLDMASAAPLFMITEVLIWLGYLIFAYLIFQNACRD